MWPRRSHTLANLTRINSNKRKFKCSKTKQDAFDEFKRTVDSDSLSTYPDFNETFKFHIDASAFQLGAVIIQKVKTIAFYGRKLTDSQKRYTATDKELLSTLETLKEFIILLLVQKLITYNDQKNLTYKNFNNDRLLIWRLIIE